MLIIIIFSLQIVLTIPVYVSAIIENNCLNHRKLEQLINAQGELILWPWQPHLENLMKELMPEAVNYELEDEDEVVTRCHTYRQTDPTSMDTLLGFNLPTQSSPAASGFLFDLRDCAARTIFDYLPEVEEKARSLGYELAEPLNLDCVLKYGGDGTSDVDAPQVKNSPHILPSKALRCFYRSQG